MATQLQTPTIKPPTSLELLDKDQVQQQGQGGVLEAPKTTATSVATLAPPTQPSTGLPGPNVSQFASQQMANPSRWNLDMVRQGVDLINQEMEQSAQRGTADLDEFYSSRGLVGSSVESQGRGDFLSQLERTKSQRMFDLTREMANTFATDVANAGQLGLGARAQELQAMGMASDDAYRYAVLEQSGSQFQQGMQFDRERLAAEMGLSREQLDLQRDQMTAEFGDRQAQRLFEMGLQAGSQEFQATQNALNRALEETALQLQRQGLDYENAWRQADQQLEERALALQERGMTADQAYRALLADQQAQLSAADIYLRALAAGAGDYLPAGQTLAMPNWTSITKQMASLPQPQLPQAPLGYDPTNILSGWVP